MGKFNYNKSQNTAHKLIDKFGAAGSVMRHATAYAAEPVTLVVVNYSNRQVDGTRIREGDRLIYISVKAPGGGIVAEPGIADRIQDSSGVVYEIINSSPVAPAGIPVVYEVQGRA